MTKNILFISFVWLSLAQLSFAQTPAKKKLAGQLTANTVALFPVQFFEDSFTKLNIEKTAEMEKDLSASLSAKLENSNLTDEEKDILKPRITDFTRKISGMVKDVVMRDFNIKPEANKLLEKQYLKVFTLAELQKLNNFFKTANGQLFVKKFNYLITGKLDGKDAGFTDLDEKEFEQLSKGLGIRLLEKFYDSLFEKVMDDIGKYVDSWANQLQKNIEKEMTTGSIKKETDKFIAENFPR